MNAVLHFAPVDVSVAKLSICSVIAEEEEEAGTRSSEYVWHTETHHDQHLNRTAKDTATQKASVSETKHFFPFLRVLTASCAKRKDELSSM